MDWTQIVIAVVGGIFGLFAVEGVGYLVINKLVMSKREKVEVNKEQQEVEKAKEDNKKEDIATGLQALSFYEELEGMIIKHTKPLEDKIDELKRKQDLTCCFRPICEMRLRNVHDLTEADIIEWGESYEIIKKK